MSPNCSIFLQLLRRTHHNLPDMQSHVMVISYCRRRYSVVPKHRLRLDYTILLLFSIGSILSATAWRRKNIGLYKREAPLTRSLRIIMITISALARDVNFSGIVSITLALSVAANALFIILHFIHGPQEISSNMTAFGRVTLELPIVR